jgi:hypothetical protein
VSDRSRLGDLIVMHGPYEPYEVIPNPVTRYLESDELNALRTELIKLREIQTDREATYEEWRVTGTDEDGDPISVTYSEDGYDLDPKAGAQAFVAWVETQGWTDGPHLHKRTVTVTDWTEVDA